MDPTSAPTSALQATTNAPTSAHATAPTSATSALHTQPPTPYRAACALARGNRHRPSGPHSDTAALALRSRPNALAACPKPTEPCPNRHRTDQPVTYRQESAGPRHTRQPARSGDWVPSRQGEDSAGDRVACSRSRPKHSSQPPPTDLSRGRYQLSPHCQRERPARGWPRCSAPGPRAPIEP
jgi:hypothetical protein